MHKLIFTTFLAFAAWSGVKAQSRNGTNEFGVMMGISQYQGELAKYAFTPEATHGAIALYFRDYVAGNFSLKGQGEFTMLDGFDSYATNNKDRQDKRQKRGHSFSSNIIAANLTLEYNLFKADKRNQNKVNPYVFAGAGLFHFNPRASIKTANGTIKEYYLRDLPTELNKPKYNLTQLNIPFGIGVRKKSKSGWITGLIFQFNYTFTDYIDDMSGMWANYNAVLESHGRDVALLTDRSREKLPNPDAGYQKENVTQVNGSYKKLFGRESGVFNRGLASTNDTYYYIGFTIGRAIGIKSGGTSDGFGGGLFRTRKKCFRF